MPASPDHTPVPGTAADQTVQTQLFSTPLNPEANETSVPGTMTGAGHAETPQVIAGYVIERELGRGGMGVVYRARQPGLNRVVALKMILHADHAGAEDRLRFRREAEALARLRHPNIVQVYEVGEHEGKPFISP